MALPLSRRRFNADEYERMAAAAILAEDDRVELIDGEIVEMAPIGHRHASCVNRLNRLFSLAFGDAAVVSVQNPVRLDDQSEPQPDLALLRPRADFYATGHPRPADVLLIVEVAETSGDYDRQVKLPLYARSGIPEAWLVDLQRDTVTSHRGPTADGYRTVQTLRRGEQVAPLAFSERALTVTAILGEF
jgi:Uma2 family endonuclease